VCYSVSLRAQLISILVLTSIRLKLHVVGDSLFHRKAWHDSRVMYVGKYKTGTKGGSVWLVHSFYGPHTDRT
jgi:putative copper export protein